MPTRQLPESTEYSPDLRLIRVVLPLDLIQRVDELLIRGVGGYRSRQEFIRDAVEALVLELSYAPAPDEPALRDDALGEVQHRQMVAPIASSPPSSARREPPEAPPLPPPDINVHGMLDFSRLLPTPDVKVVESPGAVVVDEPLFGLHNRDYPSLWLASRLAQATRSSLVDDEDFIAQALKEAWSLGEKLQALEKRTGTRLSSLFPTNRQKSGRAEEAFRNFAFGQVTRLDNGLRASGPLFTWRIVQVQATDSHIGLTPHGLKLLQQLSGLSAMTPHDRTHAEAFLAHLREHAPADWWGFQTVLREVGKGAARLDLLQRFRAEMPRWTESQVSTNVSGYVARAREWGLLESKQSEGKYLLTEFGGSFIGAA